MTVLAANALTLPLLGRTTRGPDMEFKERTLMQIADMICNFKPEESFFRYRCSSYLTEFFEDCETDYRHDRPDVRATPAHKSL